MIKVYRDSDRRIHVIPLSKVSVVVPHEKELKVKIWFESKPDAEFFISFENEETITLFLDQIEKELYELYELTEVD